MFTRMLEPRRMDRGCMSEGKHRRRFAANFPTPKEVGQVDWVNSVDVDWLKGAYRER